MKSAVINGNIRGLLSTPGKLNYIKSMVEHYNASIVTITESHLKYEMPVEFSIPNYNTYCTHRSGRNGGCPPVDPSGLDKSQSCFL